MIHVSQYKKNIYLQIGRNFQTKEQNSFEAGIFNRVELSIARRNEILFTILLIEFAISAQKCNSCL